jgi:hypothetical protein
MTTDEALALIRESTPYKTENGQLVAAWTRWARNNPGEATKLDAFVADAAPPPQLETKFGKGWVALIGNEATQPEPEPVRTLMKGAIVVIAGNMNVDLLRQAGVTHVAVELTAENGVDFATSRWDGFQRGWFIVSRGNDGDTIAKSLAAAALGTFAIVDTESHKTDIGGSRAWTDTLYAAVRSKLGQNWPLYNITFGVNSSPEVVNHIAFRRWNVAPIWEAYGSEGSTYGVDRTAEKAALEGWVRPHIALGDKSLVRDVVDLKAGAALALGGVWLYGADMGPAQEALAAGAASALRGLA